MKGFFKSTVVTSILVTNIYFSLYVYLIRSFNLIITESKNGCANILLSVTDSSLKFPCCLSSVL